MFFKKVHIFSFSAYILFFLILGIFFLFQKIPASKIYSLGFQNDFILLKDYEQSPKKYTGGLLTIDKYKDYNTTYGNIFSYFELPANSEGRIVPLKGAGRVFMKAPIFLISGPHLFPFIWRSVGLIVGLFLFISVTPKENSNKKFLLFLSLLFFSPILTFDPEFIFFFCATIMLLKFFLLKNVCYLFFYFIFGLYVSNFRNEYFIFLNIYNIYLLYYIFRSKKYQYLIFILLFFSFFLSGFMLSNEQYYGGFFKTGYEFLNPNLSSLSIGKDGENLFASAISKFFPFGFFVNETFRNVFYVLNSTVGLGSLMFILGNRRINSIYRKSGTFFYFVIFITIYGAFFYGSNKYFYKPNDDPTFSSYTRYLSVFIIILWALLYRRLFFLSRISKIFYSTFIIIYLILGIHFYGGTGSDLNSGQYISSIEHKIPKGSYVLTLRPVKFLLSDYHIMRPSGLDEEEFTVFYLFGRTSRNGSNFLSNVGRFVRETKNPVYLVGSGQYYDKLVGFFIDKTELNVKSFSGYSVINSKTW